MASWIVVLDICGLGSPKPSITWSLILRNLSYTIACQPSPYFYSLCFSILHYASNLVTTSTTTEAMRSLPCLLGTLSFVQTEIHQLPHHKAQRNPLINHWRLSWFTVEKQTLLPTCTSIPVLMFCCFLKACFWRPSLYIGWRQSTWLGCLRLWVCSLAPNTQEIKCMNT